jgi:hypothetical protein
MQSQVTRRTVGAQPTSWRRTHQTCARADVPDSGPLPAISRTRMSTQTVSHIMQSYIYTFIHSFKRLLAEQPLQRLDEHPDFHLHLCVRLKREHLHSFGQDRIELSTACFALAGTRPCVQSFVELG